MIKVGDVAPDFSLSATWLENDKPQMLSLSSYRGNKNVLLMFYPLDWSPVCSSEHKKCTSMFPTVSDRVQILGISVDSIWSHNATPKPMESAIPSCPTFSRAERWRSDTASTSPTSASPPAPHSWSIATVE